MPTGIPAARSGLAAALAKFQAKHTTIAQGGVVSGGPRQGSKYVDLPSILKVCSEGAAFGLSHYGEPRHLGGTNVLIYREVLEHVSGEKRYAECPIPITEKGVLGQRMQDLGAGITYARKYCLMCLYGLQGGDGDDPDATSYSETSRPVTPPSAPVQQAAASLANGMGEGSVVVSNGVAVEQQQSPPATDAQRDPHDPLTAADVALAKEIIKDKENGATWKAEFMKKFYPSYEGKMTVGHLKEFRHLDFLMLCRSGSPF